MPVPSQVCYLLRDGAAVPVEVPPTRAGRRRGLLGRNDLEGGLLLEGVRSVHTFGMRFTIDIALLDRTGTVLHTATLPPGRVTRPRLGSASVLEMQAGSLVRWAIEPGDRLEFVETT